MVVVVVVVEVVDAAVALLVVAVVAVEGKGDDGTAADGVDGAEDEGIEEIVLASCIFRCQDLLRTNTLKNCKYIFFINITMSCIQKVCI